MAVPDFQTLMLPLLRAAARGETTLPQAISRIVGDLQISEADQDERLESGRGKRLYNRIAWAKTHLAHAGLLDSPRRGVFVASQRGRELLSRNPERIDMRTLMVFPEYVEFRRGRVPPGGAVPPTDPPAPADELTPEERIEAAVREITQELQTQILERVCSGPPDLLEEIVVKLLDAMGYGHDLGRGGRVIGGTGDGGIDGVINQDPLGLGVVYVQAKRHQPGNTVGAELIRAFSGALNAHGADRGVFVTTSGFTAGAREAARSLRSQRVVLIDGSELARLMVRHGIGVRTKQVAEVKALDPAFFEPEGAGP